MIFPSKLPHVGTTIFTVMSALARQHGAVNLAQGFPDFDPDPRLSERCVAALAAGRHQYAPMTGLPELRLALATAMREDFGIDYDADSEVTITAGATQALFSALGCLLHTGDECLIFEPAYDSYGPAILMNGAVPVPVTMKAPDFRWDWDAAAAKITYRTRAIVVNSPHNPTGSCFTEADLIALESLAEKHGLWVISDEVYAGIVHDGRRHFSCGSREVLRSRSFVCMSFGKTFHCTGWKVGACLAPAALSAEFRKAHQFTTFSVNTPAQAALADLCALREARRHGDFFEQRRDLLISSLAGSGLRPLRPCQGSYFQLFDYSALSDENDLDFAIRLTRERGVASIPLSPFSAAPDPAQRLIRLCFAKKPETLLAAAERLVSEPG